MSIISGWELVSISILYIGCLFLVAHFGDKYNYLYENRYIRPQIYSLSLAVYFTSWTFYGAVGRASTEGLGFFPIYLGPLIVFFFFGPLLDRIIRISKSQKTTSIADFIAARYGKSQTIAVLVTVIAVLGLVPYIALQLKGVSLGFNVLTEGSDMGIQSPIFTDTAWWVACLLAVFTILFGTRHLDATEHHQGMIQAVAFESIIKLVAFIGVGLFVCYSLYDGIDDIFTRIHQSTGLERFSLGRFDTTSFLAQTLVAACAIICLPRQFHVTVVENYQRQDLQVARVMMPLFLLAATAFVLPIAGAGWLNFGSGVNADTLVLQLPLQAGQKWLSILAFIGGGSAATAMVIVSSVALSTMVCNEIVIPLLFRFFRERLDQYEQLDHIFLFIRRITIVGLLILSYGFYRLAAAEYSLTAFGLLSFVAVAQFAPAMIGGIVWRRGNQSGAIAGLSAGFLTWLYTLVLPTLIESGWLPEYFLKSGLFGWQWSIPTALFGSQMDFITHGIVWSLGINLTLFIGISLIRQQTVRERIQVAAFFHDIQPDTLRSGRPESLSQTKIDDVRAMAERFMGTEKTNAIFAIFEQRYQKKLTSGHAAPVALVRFVERHLASTIGSSTARVIIDSTLKGRDMALEDVASIVDEASQVVQFNRDLLQAALENINMGISVVDEEQKLVAWNHRYVSLFNFPKGYIRVGRPIEDLIRFNLVAANLGSSKVDALIRERIQLMRDGTPHEYERERPDGTVLRIQGNPTPGGGFVTTFADITDLRRTTRALKETNTYLEERVKDRTRALSNVNSQLRNAMSLAENANQSKTRFLASASHDLLQPINAAKLFTSSLTNKPTLQREDQEIARHIDDSLTAAEEILSTLLDISKLDAGIMTTDLSIFCLNDLLLPLSAEFGVLARDQGIELSAVNSSLWIKSDQQLLRRVLQNFLSNALRYTLHGKVLLGVRRQGEHARIEVWDTGPGIPEEEQSRIFEEFRRLNHGEGKPKGLGLGLAIVDRISRVLNHQVDVRSWQGKGSVFSIQVPLEQAPKYETKLTDPVAPLPNLSRSAGGFEGLPVLCVDNDASILEGMSTLLKSWQCQVFTACDLAGALALAQQHTFSIMLTDYQLDNDENGLDLMDAVQKLQRIPGVLVTAQKNDELKEQVRKRGYQYLSKPVKPAALRAIMNNQLR